MFSFLLFFLKFLSEKLIIVLSLVCHLCNIYEVIIIFCKIDKCKHANVLGENYIYRCVWRETLGVERLQC